ncbi:iron complex transport system substrate-binding protein [Evansella caseinilytica]|uniref:Iron complex transport system substrate-binding protein n=1 Tax=Evansella caseinilytica TaxID=1503961 RepID=A0A1H3STC9_9BACI|nr:ABC transporter substrate-binding protein [Evansella caseinilytica]SDZ41000.1 iron complex transport system substrate-binding protein [Evansella caseinilytica]
MVKKLLSLLLVALFMLAACGNQDTTGNEDSGSEDTASNGSDEDDDAIVGDGTQTIVYLGENYPVPAAIEKIVTASLESMEDALMLGVKPDGAIATGGEFPEYFGDSMSEAAEIGDKMQPSNEILLQIEPDVILGTSKFQPEVAENLNSIATMIPISHFSTDWKDNLLVLAELAGKTEEAEAIIDQYENDAANLREQLAEKMADKTILMVRIRGGSVYIYSEDVYFNPVLYSDLALPVPEEIQASETQEMISLEKLAEMNPDYLFVQFEETENAEAPDALSALQDDAIWQSMEAAKNDRVFVNSVAPMAAGGTAWSKTEFLKVVEEKLLD